MVAPKGVKRRAGEASIETNEASSKQAKLTQLPGPRSPTLTTASEQSQALTESKVSSGKKTNGSSRTPASKKKEPAKQLYEATIKAVDKIFNQLVRQYKPNPNGWYGITADNFAAAMAQQISGVKKLQEHGSSSLAFNLVLDLGEHAYGDLEACVKAGGFGDTDKPYQEMDRLLAEIIATRRCEEETATGSASDTTTAEEESEKAEYQIEPSRDDLGTEEERLRENVIDKKRGPNKQQRGELKRARLADLRKLFEVRRQRRATTGDWAGNALNELVETRARIDQYGIGDDFFKESIGLLASIKGVKTPSANGRDL
ncbi:hypothetical protein HD806DRAFT_447584 [Xylariaceae sp. AK1471]|nr:hypothetical protein HD806DRAFT_447584 [Xylariaceae sp. AK1471]